MKSRKWLVIIILILVAYVAWKYLWPRGEQQSENASQSEAALVLDRVWVDSFPEQDTDHVQAMLMLSDIPMGVFQRASAYQLTIEVFEFKRHQNKVRLRFPQSDRSDRFSFKVHECDDLPPFDLCLDLSANPWQGPKRYYSLSDEDSERASKARGADALDRLEVSLRQRLLRANAASETR